MTLNFYDLQVDPFANTSNPAWFFASRGHQAALEALLESLKAHQSLALLLGEAGVGKTFLLHTALAHSDLQHIKQVHVFYPKLSLPDIFKVMCRDLGLDEVTYDAAQMAHALHRALLTEHERGHRVVLIIDEASTIPIDILANLLQLSNFKAFTGEPLLQMVLVGLPELWRHFRTPLLQPFKPLAVTRVVLPPLTYGESLAYIRHRLQQACVDASTETVFAPGAVRAVAKQAGGNPRTINVLCTHMLISGFLARQRPISAHIAQDVIMASGVKSSHTQWRWGVTAASLLAVATMVGLLSSTHQLPSERGPRRLLQLTRGLLTVSGADTAQPPTASSHSVPTLSTPPALTIAPDPTLAPTERPTPTDGSPADRVFPAAPPLPAQLPEHAPDTFGNVDATAIPHGAPPTRALQVTVTDRGSAPPMPSTISAEDACILDMLRGKRCTDTPAPAPPATPSLP